LSWNDEFSHKGFLSEISRKTWWIGRSTALGLWKNSSGHNNVILNKGGWANYEWKSLGASMYGAYAVVWFAKAADPDTVAICP